MNGRPYIDGDTLADVHNALGCGVPIELLAAQLECDPRYLRQRAGLPQRSGDRPAELQMDLFATDRLDAVL